MLQRGFTYLAVLFAVAIIGAVLASTSVVWHAQAQREKEQELLYIGKAYRQAIARYYEGTPGTAKQFPKKLEDLLEDNRQTRLTRYLRKLYRDPMTNSQEWGLVTAPDTSIVGVYSRSTRAPIKQAKFAEEDREFVGAASYQDWKFIFTQPAQAAPSANSGDPANPPNPSLAPGASSSPPGAPIATPAAANP